MTIKFAGKGFQYRLSDGTMPADDLREHKKSSEQVALSFAFMRWMSLTMVIAFPFTFGHGLIRTGSLVGMCVLGVLVLTCFLLGWRSRKQIWLSCAFCLAVLVPPHIGRGDGPLPDSHFYQRIVILFAVTGLPLLLFPSFFRRFVRIPEKADPAQQSASAS